MVFLMLPVYQGYGIFIKLYFRRCEMEALSSLGIFFAGLGVFFLGCGLMWFISLYSKKMTG